jgi:hypothetical protein
VAVDQTDRQSRTTVRCTVYGVIAFAALILTWSQNLAFFAQRDNGGLAGFLRDAWANHAAASLGNDVILVALTAAVFMVIEARRLGIRHVWVFFVLALGVAISVAFPLFLIVRERRLAAGH